VQYLLPPNAFPLQKTQFEYVIFFFFRAVEQVFEQKTSPL